MPWRLRMSQAVERPGKSQGGGRCGGGGGGQETPRVACLHEGEQLLAAPGGMPASRTQDRVHDLVRRLIRRALRATRMLLQPCRAATQIAVDTLITRLV